MTSFNTQPPEGGWHKNKKEVHTDEVVSTHSRPKAAGTSWLRSKNRRLVSTHSRPKAAGVVNGFAFGLFGKFQHTAARRRLEVAFEKVGSQAVFQHTAARRRLAL